MVHRARLIRVIARTYSLRCEFAFNQLTRAGSISIVHTKPVVVASNRQRFVRFSSTSTAPAAAVVSAYLLRRLDRCSCSSPARVAAVEANYFLRCPMHCALFSLERAAVVVSLSLLRHLERTCDSSRGSICSPSSGALYFTLSCASRKAFLGRRNFPFFCFG